MQTSRRQFLQVGLAGAAAVAVNTSVKPQRALAAPASAADNVLVVIQLSGGNDGLNTVIPTRSAAYRKARPHIAIADGCHRLSGGLTLNPGMGAFKNLFDQGKLAVVNGCGYPQPSRSHFRSAEIWHSADPVRETSHGWLGQYLDHASRDSGLSITGVYAGSMLPQALVSEPAAISRARSLRDFVADDDYPHGLDAQLRVVARRIDADRCARVFWCQLGGFDTHANQLGPHRNQLAQLADAVAAFHADLAARGHADRVAVMCFSEFGRRVAENNSNGTDHGTAGPVFLVGNGIRGGLYGAYPSLTDLDDQGDLKYTTDFRRVYATLLDRWLGVDAACVLGNRFEPIAFL